MDDPTDIIEGEEVTEVETKLETSNNFEILQSLENIIKNHIVSLDKLQVEIRQHREMLDSEFENSQVFKEHNDLAKEAIKVKNTTKQEILKQPSMIALNAKLKDFQTEYKTRSRELSDLLPEYQRLSGQNVILTDDGGEREIVTTAKLIKRQIGVKK